MCWLSNLVVNCFLTLLRWEALAQLLRVVVVVPLLVVSALRRLGRVEELEARLYSVLRTSSRLSLDRSHRC